MRREIERVEVQIRRQSKEALEQARALAEQTESTSWLELEGHLKKAIEQQQIQRRNYEKQQRHFSDGDMVRRGYQSSPEAARDENGDNRRQLGNFEEQLAEMRKQVSQMNRQMSEMRRAMDKLMRSPEAAADRRR